MALSRTDVVLDCDGCACEWSGIISSLNFAIDCLGLAQGSFLVDFVEGVEFWVALLDPLQALLDVRFSAGSSGTNLVRSFGEVVLWINRMHP